MFKFFNKLIYIIGVIIESSLIFRILFKFVEAPTSVPFVHWLYSFTDWLLHPFWGFVQESLVYGYVIDWLAIVGMLIYLFILFILMEIFNSF